MVCALEVEVTRHADESERWFGSLVLRETAT
jgi:hypothetical protein